MKVIIILILLKLLVQQLVISSYYYYFIGIPHLVVLNESFKIINDNGRSMVEKDPEAKV